MQTLVLLSGTLGTEKLWQHQIKGLSELADVRIPDLAQHSTMTEVAESILDNSPEKFAVAGFSMGGIIAQELLKQAPERISKLALLDTSTGKPDSTKLERFESWQSANHETFEGIVAALQTWVHKDNQAAQPIIKNMALDLGLEVFKCQAGILLTQDNSDASILKAYKGSTMIIHGEDDPVSSVQGHKDIEQLIPNSTRIALKNCGHFAPLEKPVQVTTALKEWLQAN